MAEQWGLSPFSIGRLRAGASVSADGFTLWLENGQLQSCQAIPNEPDWQPEGQQTVKQGQPDEYAIPEGDQDWPMLVELCGKVYQVQGHTGAHRWIEMLPQPYQSEMWRVLEELATPEWMQEQGDYSEQECKASGAKQGLLCPSCITDTARLSRRDTDHVSDPSLPHYSNCAFR